VLGYEVVGQSRPGPKFDWIWLKHNGYELMLNTMYEEDLRPPAPDPARRRAHRDVCIYFGCKDVDGAYDYLRSKGVEAKKPHVAPYGMKQLYFEDPDGYELCFQRPATEAEKSSASAMDK
jgi:catechol 2,3-dioxygenase-like lactoylglutathione lyase family enzyme